MKVRLKCNVIIGKEFLSKGTLVDSDILPEHLQTPEIMGDTDPRQGKVLLLCGITYSSMAGNNVGYPITLAAGELVDLAEIPPRQLEMMTEGQDYKTDWNQQDRNRVLAEVEREYKKSLSFDSADVPLRGR